MNKYVVKIVHVFANLVEVEANDESDAREKASAKLQDPNNTEQVEHFYESTFPPENWPVITKEKFEELKAQVENGILGNQEEKSNVIQPNIITP